MTFTRKMSLLIIFLIISLNVFAQDVDWYWYYPYPLGKYHIIQYRANVRMEPTRNSDVIAILSFYDEIEILENSRIQEEINDVWGFWYKIKYGNIIGYTFGGNIAYETIVTDIDKNGINDYFCYRFSRSKVPGFAFPYLDTYSDIIIYINNQRIGTTNLITDLNVHRFEECHFSTEIDETGIKYVILELVYYGRDDSGFVYFFRVKPDGKIEPIYGNGNGLYPNNHFD
jgi:hypothetical protein